MGFRPVTARRMGERATWNYMDVEAPAPRAGRLLHTQLFELLEFGGPEIGHGPIGHGCISPFEFVVAIARKAARPRIGRDGRPREELMICFLRW